MALTSTRELVTLEIRGVTPLIHDNIANAMDPRNEQTRLINELISRSVKLTEQQQKELSLLEWRRTLYTDSAGQLVYPAQNLLNSFIEAAKAFKLGAALERGAITSRAVEFPLRYGTERLPSGELKQGPADLRELSEDERYQLRIPVNGNPSKGKRSAMVTKTRSVFPEWELTMRAVVFGDLISWGDFERVMAAAGQTGNGRKIGYGRYAVTVTRQT